MTSRNAARLASRLHSRSAGQSAFVEGCRCVSSTARAPAAPTPDAGPSASRADSSVRDIRLPAEPLSGTPTARPQRGSLPSPFEPAKVHPPTHGHHVASLHLRAYRSDATLENLDFFADFALRSAYALGMPCTRPAMLPTTMSLWTVPKGPFVHKKSQENFTRHTHSRVLKVYDSHPDVVDRWLRWCRIHGIAGVGQRVEVFRHHPITLAQDMARTADRQLNGSGFSNVADGQPEQLEAEFMQDTKTSEGDIKRLAKQVQKDLDRADEEGRKALEVQRAALGDATDRSAAEQTFAAAADEPQSTGASPELHTNALEIEGKEEMADSNVEALSVNEQSTRAEGRDFAAAASQSLANEASTPDIEDEAAATQAAVKAPVDAVPSTAEASSLQKGLSLDADSTQPEVRGAAGQAQQREQSGSQLHETQSMEETEKQLEVTEEQANGDTRSTRQEELELEKAKHEADKTDR